MNRIKIEMARIGSRDFLQLALLGFLVAGATYAVLTSIRPPAPIVFHSLSPPERKTDADDSVARANVILPDKPVTRPAKPPKTGVATNAVSRHKQGPEKPVKLNTATAAQLMKVPGIGPALAKRILDYRAAHGRFTTLDELIAVKGLGPKKLAGMRKFLTL